MTRKWLFGLALLAAVVGVCGCQTLSFYRQAVTGQFELYAHARPIKKLRADPQTPARLKERLQLVLNLRAFAAEQLKLPIDGHYEKYADLHRPFVVWNVEAAPEFSLAPKTWWYPLVGRLEYRGYFSERAAQDYGAALHQKGYDVYIDGVPAYSTLGWFKDPVLNTFVFEPDADLAEVIFHELGHQRVFAHGDTDFNEAFATTVGQEGARRWLEAQGDAAALAAYRAELRRTSQFAHLIAETRVRLAALYGDETTRGGALKATNKKNGVAPAELRREKQRLLERLQQEYAELRADWGGNREYEAWFARHLNNAKLNSVAAYYDFVPAFERLLAANGGDLEKFYQAAERLSKTPARERHGRLRNLAARQAE